MVDNRDKVLQQTEQPQQRHRSAGPDPDRTGAGTQNGPALAWRPFHYRIGESAYCDSRFGSPEPLGRCLLLRRVELPGWKLIRCSSEP